MKTLFIFVLFTLLSFSLQVIEPERTMDDARERPSNNRFKNYLAQNVNDDIGGGGSSSSSSSSSSSQSNKTKQFEVTPKFIQCLKNTTAVPISIINSISTKTDIYMTEEYEYVTSGYSQMTLNKINARFKFCAIVIEGPPPATRGCSADYSCGNDKGVTECFKHYLGEADRNDLEIAYDSRTVQATNARSGTSKNEKNDRWEELIVRKLDSDPGYFVDCLENNNCTYYFGAYLGYYIDH